FLSDGVYGMWCAITVNTWRGMPFFAITLLAGLQTINPDLHEAASLAGANGWKRFWHVTWPVLQPVTVVVVGFSFLQSFSAFPLVAQRIERRGRFRRGTGVATARVPVPC